MTTINAKTYSGATIPLNKKLFQKAAKACAMRGLCNPNIENPTNEQIVQYLRAKNASFHHSLHTANLYSMKIVGRNIFVI